MRRRSDTRVVLRSCNRALSALSALCGTGTYSLVSCSFLACVAVQRRVEYLACPEYLACGHCQHDLRSLRVSAPRHCAPRDALALPWAVPPFLPSLPALAFGHIDAPHSALVAVDRLALCSATRTAAHGLRVWRGGAGGATALAQPRLLSRALTPTLVGRPPSARSAPTRCAVREGEGCAGYQLQPRLLSCQTAPAAQRRFRAPARVPAVRSALPQRAAAAALRSPLTYPPCQTLILLFARMSVCFANLMLLLQHANFSFIAFSRFWQLIPTILTILLAVAEARHTGGGRCDNQTAFACDSLQKKCLALTRVVKQGRWIQCRRARPAPSSPPPRAPHRRLCSCPACRRPSTPPKRLPRASRSRSAPAAC